MSRVFWVDFPWRGVSVVILEPPLPMMNYYVSGKTDIREWIFKKIVEYIRSIPLPKLRNIDLQKPADQQTYSPRDEHHQHKCVALGKVNQRLLGSFPAAL